MVNRAPIGDIELAYTEFVGRTIELCEELNLNKDEIGLDVTQNKYSKRTATFLNPELAFKRIDGFTLSAAEALTVYKSLNTLGASNVSSVDLRIENLVKKNESGTYSLNPTYVICFKDELGIVIDNIKFDTSEAVFIKWNKISDTLGIK